MAFMGASDDFDLDDDGILRDSLSRASLIIDDDGIIQDDDTDLYQHVVQGQWTDSGIGGGDRQSMTSTLHIRKRSLEEDLTLGHDESINISELEASKEDISFVRQIEKYDVINPEDRNKSSSLDFLDSRESTLDKPHNYKTDLSIRNDQKDTSGHYLEDLSRSQLFPDDYYRQLHDLGVLIDGVDLSRDSINEFDETESHVASHIGGQGDGNVRDSQDLIGEYLEHELRKEEEENGEGRQVSGRGSDFRQSSLAYSHASSQDISSFFDEGDHIDNNISENVEGNGNSEHQKRARKNDDELYYVSGHVFPSQSEEIARGDNLLQPQGSDIKSRVNLPVGQTTEPKSITAESQAGIPSTGSAGRGEMSNDDRYFYSEVFSTGSRPSSRTSHVSVESGISSTRHRNSPVRLARVSSQESFSEEKQRAQKKMEKPHQRRLLPQPSSSEPSQSLRVKNAHPNTIASKQEPVKPNHESGSKTRGLPGVKYEEEVVGGEETDKTEIIDESTKQLLDRLTQEAVKRKQATELFQHLQKDYGNLLTKYAQAELTIDQMRFVRMITLNADSPTPSQAQSGVMSPALSQQAAVTSLHMSPSRAVLMTSPAQGMMGHAATSTDGIDQFDRGSQPAPGNQSSRSRLDIHRGSVVSLLQSTDGADVTEKVSETRVETVRCDLLLEAKTMEDRLESFCTLLDGGQVTLENQELMFERIKSDHDTLRRAYLQVKDEYNVLRRSGALTSELQTFDQNKELEGYLFRLGMRFDEVNDTVENNLKEKSKQRRPFQENQTRRYEDIRQGTDSKNDLTHGRRGSGALTNQQTASNGSKTDVTDSADAWTLETRVHQLREEYNTNMDAYRKLKYSASTPEGVREIEHIVMKLDDICTEIPDMFRLSPEIQARRDQMARENKLKIHDRKSSVWEKLNKREQEVKQHRMSPVSPLLRDSNSSVPYNQLDERAPKILRQGSHSSDQDSLRARLDGASSRSSLTSILPDRMDRLPSRSNSLTDQLQSHSSTDRPSSRASNRGYSSADPDRRLSRSGIPGGDHSFSDSMSGDPDSSSPSFRRPRRHEHGDMKEPTLSQMPGVGSLRNLAYTTATDETRRSRDIMSRSRHQSPQTANADGASGLHDGYNNMEGALAALPGPGKLKQLTKQRAADDADSGFIGSMVGSGVGLDPTELQQQRQQIQQQQQQQQHQQSVRLRLSKAVDESSTLTDQSMDASTHQEDRPRKRTEIERTKGQKQLRNELEHSAQIQKEDSYDVEDSSTENVSFAKQIAVQNDSQTGIRGKDENSKEFYNASLGDSYSTASDISTPRAVNQSHSETVVREPVGSSQPPLGRTTPIKSQKASADGHALSETDSVLDSTDRTRGRRSVSEASQASDREEETSQGRLRSLPSPGRPPSRGTPTTDLHHTRQTPDLHHTRQRTDSAGDRRKGQRHAEPTGKREQDQRQKRGHVREDQQQPAQEQTRFHHRQHASSASDLHDGPSPDTIHSEITRKVKEYEERSVGSDVEVFSNVTRSSSVASSSNRLKALQEEIERLKEGVARANERANQPPPPAQIYHIPAPTSAPTSAQPQQQDPGYYDQFDDPYGFMRMPRRRANSFSGGREREWDEWYWTLPQNRQYDGGDIPLGYAAADAYADLPAGTAQQRPSRESFKNRLRQRPMTNERQRRDVQPGEPVPDAHPAHLAASQQSHLTANQPQAAANEQRAALYEYYLPSRFNVSGVRQQTAPQGRVRDPGMAKIYSSTGEDGDNEEEHDIIDNSGYPGRTADANNRPWYHIQRMPRTLAPNLAHTRAFLQPGGDRLSQSHDNLSHLNQTGQPPFSQYLRPQVGPAVVGGQRTATQVCPTCGGSGSHSHTEYQPQVGRPNSRAHPPPQYSSLRDSSPTRVSRRQSRSPSHNAAGRSSSQSRYRVREYSRLSDSEDEERITRRSRSLSRGRSRASYNHRSQARRHRQQSHSGSDQSGDEETDLDHSLSLSVDIANLTKKMLGTVSGELLRVKDKREFGSSFW